MPRRKTISAATPRSAGAPGRVVCEAPLYLVAIVLTILDLCGRLLVFFLAGVCRMCMKLVFFVMLAATAILAYCILMALSLVPGQAANSQLP